MSSQTENTEPFESTPGDGSGSRLRFGRYLTWLVGPMIFFYALPFVLLRIPGFEDWGGSTFGPALNFGFKLGGKDADVVIFGDSSASVGIDPRQVSKELGLRVVNIPNTGSSLPVTQDLALRHYLQANKPPRMIVFYFTAWDLDYSHPAHEEGGYEGEEMLMTNGSRSEILRFAREHPIDMLLFPFQFFSANPPAVARAIGRHQRRGASVADALGFFDPMPNRSPMDAPCTFEKAILNQERTETVRRLAETYRTKATLVLVYIAPIPICTNSDVFIKRSYGAVTGAPPAEMSPSAFKSDGSYSHVVAGAVPEATELLTESVRRALAGAGGGATR